MNGFQIIITSLAVSMDAFAASICKGLNTKHASLNSCFSISIWFGFFQGLMILFGYLIGNTLKDIIFTYDHWLAFCLLTLIGALMIKEGIKPNHLSYLNESNIILAFATSIDAMAIGVSYGILPNINLIFTVLSVGLTTLFISMLGVKIGRFLGAKYKFVAEISGGTILIAIGVKILIEHLCFK